MRQLTRANQGRNHFATEAEAEAYREAFNRNNNPETLISVFGTQAIGTFEVRPVRCYDHGDAMEIYFDK